MDLQQGADRGIKRPLPQLGGNQRPAHAAPIGAANRFCAISPEIGKIFLPQASCAHIEDLLLSWFFLRSMAYAIADQAMGSGGMTVVASVSSSPISRHMFALAPVSLWLRTTARCASCSMLGAPPGADLRAARRSRPRPAAPMHRLPAGAARQPAHAGAVCGPQPGRLLSNLDQVFPGRCMSR